MFLSINLKNEEKKIDRLRKKDMKKCIESFEKENFIRDN